MVRLDELEEGAGDGEKKGENGDDDNRYDDESTKEVERFANFVGEDEADNKCNDSG